MKHKKTILAIIFALLFAVLAWILIDYRNKIKVAGTPDLPPDVLFQDDFSDPSSGWDRAEIEGSIANYLDEQYHILVNESHMNVWTNPGLDFGDVAIEVEATKIGGPDDSDYGIICRYHDISNFYYVVIDSSGYYAIAKMVDREPKIIGFDEFEFSNAIKQGNATNTVRFDCVGSEFKLSINGEEVHAVEDDTFSSGDVGLIVGTYDTAGADVLFDNFVVRKP